MDDQIPEGMHLECEHGGAMAWGVHYPSPGRDVREATNGSAPGYVLVPDDGHVWPAAPGDVEVEAP
jgi:hypothetical protein